MLCEFFQEVFVTDKKNSKDMQLAEREMEEIPVCFHRDKVKDMLLSLKTDKSLGPESIHPMVLQRCADKLSLLLSIIFQQSFDTGQVPKNWKLAVVSPIFKKGKKSDSGNYRPVSLTLVPCKIMEAMIKTELTKYFETTRIMSDCQHGFTKGRLCLTNLLEAFEAWTRILKGGHGIDVVFLEFRKAFDSVSHKKLIIKLQAYGIDEKMINWIEDYLTGKSMAVKVNGKLSSWVTVLSGVPQS